MSLRKTNIAAEACRGHDVPSSMKGQAAHKNSRIKRNIKNSSPVRALAALFVGYGIVYFSGHPPTFADLVHKVVESRPSSQKSSNFVTIVMPSVVNPKERQRRLDAIAQTWGSAARAIYVTHDPLPQFSQPNSPTFPQVMTVPSNIAEEAGLERLIYAIRQTYKEWNPDFAFFVNDHTFVIPEHLCSYLQDSDPSHDMYVGHALKNDKEAFNSGAAGYLLSRQTMNRLDETWKEGKDPMCNIGTTDKWLAGNPGLVTARCLAHSLHTPAIDSRTPEKEHLFHAYGFVRTVEGQVDGWYVNKHVNLADGSIQGYDSTYGNIPTGPGCCAPQTISFHYVDGAEHIALHSIRLALYDNPTMSDDELKALVIKLYPSDYKMLGGYSRMLPTDTKDTEHWPAILALLRKITKPGDDKC